MGAEMKVSELLDIVTPRLVGSSGIACSFIEALRLAHLAIVNRLAQTRSDVLVEEIVVSISAGKDTGYLPDEFQSLSRRPQIVGGEFLSAPLSSDTSSLETPGTPRFFRIVGKLIVGVVEFNLAFAENGCGPIRVRTDVTFV